MACSVRSDDEDSGEGGHTASTSSGNSGGGGGISVSQLSAPRLDKTHPNGPWVVDLTLSSSQEKVPLGLDFLKDFKTVKCGRSDKVLKYGEKDQVLRKYKEVRKIEKKARLMKLKQKQQAQKAPAANNSTESVAVAAAAAAGQQPADTEGHISRQPSGGMEVLPGISFIAPDPSDEAEAAAWSLPPTPVAALALGSPKEEAQWCVR